MLGARTAAAPLALRRALAKAATLAATVAVAACSTLPSAPPGPHLDHHVAVEFVVPPNGRLVLPASSPTLSVQQLALDPAPLGEQFRDAVRWFVYAPGTRVTMRGRFRSWGDGERPPVTAQQLFTGAASVRELAR
jgi:hypothetical protein